MNDIKYKLKKSKTLRLSDSTVKNINYMVYDTKLSESELLRSIIEKAVSDYRLKKAINAIKKGSVSISNAANVAGLSYRDFFDKMIENGIRINYDEKDIDGNFDKLLTFINKNK